MLLSLTFKQWARYLSPLFIGLLSVGSCQAAGVYWSVDVAAPLKGGGNMQTSFSNAPPRPVYVAPPPAPPAIVVVPAPATVIVPPVATAPPPYYGQWRHHGHHHHHWHEDEGYAGARWNHARYSMPAYAYQY